MRMPAGCQCNSIAPLQPRREPAPLLRVTILEDSAEPGDEELAAGPSRNFQVFDPLDFLAACPP